MNEQLSRYYAQHYPFEALCAWLRQAGPLENREIAQWFTRNPKTPARYCAFADAAAMRAAFVADPPQRFDIGAVYHAPLKHWPVTKKLDSPAARELVFDIDLDAYADVRFCGCATSCCAACWPLVAAAARVTDAALRERFGFTQLLWVYSGRRGVHCWVADERACGLSEDERALVLDQLSLGFETPSSPPTQHAQRVHLGRRTNELALAMAAQLEPLFVEYCTRQRLLSDAARRQLVLLAWLPSKMTRSNLERRWAAAGARRRSDADCWREMRDAVSADLTNFEYAQSPYMIAELILSVIAPRFDRGVTKPLNHLLKAPFAVHRDTSVVAVPLDLATIEAFDPASAPTLEAVLARPALLEPFRELFARLTATTTN